MKFVIPQLAIGAANSIRISGPVDYTIKFWYHYIFVHLFEPLTIPSVAVLCIPILGSFLWLFLQILNKWRLSKNRRVPQEHVIPESWNSYDPQKKINKLLIIAVSISFVFMLIGGHSSDTSAEATKSAVQIGGIKVAEENVKRNNDGTVDEIDLTPYSLQSLSGIASYPDLTALVLPGDLANSAEISALKNLQTLEVKGNAEVLPKNLYLMGLKMRGQQFNLKNIENKLPNLSQLYIRGGQKDQSVVIRNAEAVLNLDHLFAIGLPPRILKGMKEDLGAKGGVHLLICNMKDVKKFGWMDEIDKPYGLGIIDGALKKGVVFPSSVEVIFMGYWNNKNLVVKSWHPLSTARNLKFLTIEGKPNTELREIIKADLPELETLAYSGKIFKGRAEILADAKHW